MTRPLWALALLVLPLLGCDDARKQECDKLLTAMKPLDQGTPTSDTVDAVSRQVGAIKFQYQPLGVYAENYRGTLTILSNTLRLKASGQAPDGIDDVIKKKLTEARTDKDDVQRLCSQ
jgi:hypothetical protein